MKARVTMTSSYSDPENQPSMTTSSQIIQVLLQSMHRNRTLAEKELTARKLVGQSLELTFKGLLIDRSDFRENTLLVINNC